MRRVEIITTGGTIASRVDPATGGAAPAVPADELIAMAPGLSAVAPIRVTPFGMLQSWNIGPDVMAQLAEVVAGVLAADDTAGAVVTHGTDTMEETAFALDLLIDSPRPVVLTGSMRNAGEADFEGPQNLIDAARVAADPASRGRGTLVAMNGAIHTARSVVKLHTTAVDTFGSPGSAAIGSCNGREVSFAFDVEPQVKLPRMQAAPNVYLVKMAAGTDDVLLRAAFDAGARGLVLEGSGAGNVPDVWHDAIRMFVAAGIPVVLVSRCLTGRIVPAYGGRGGGRTLHDLGVVDGGSLSGQKARVALSLALGNGMGRRELRDFFARVRS